jgi:hypothetical protein
VLELRYLQESRRSLERLEQCPGLTRARVVHGEQRALRQRRRRVQAGCA